MKWDIFNVGKIVSINHSLAIKTSMLSTQINHGVGPNVETSHRCNIFSEQSLYMFHDQVNSQAGKLHTVLKTRLRRHLMEKFKPKETEGLLQSLEHSGYVHKQLQLFSKNSFLNTFIFNNLRGRLLDMLFYTYLGSGQLCKASSLHLFLSCGIMSTFK